MQSASGPDIVKDDIAERKRFESFKLGKGLPSGMAQRHVHTRSHSRNTSISLSNFSPPSSMPASKSTSSIDTPLSSVIPSQPHLTKRNSHHRRHSSVSTRVESAEMMGVSLPDLPASSSDDNVNLGEKDSIRRRALWALEGKPDVPFTKVEIPELSTPVMEKIMFDFPIKPSAVQGNVSNYGPSLGTLMASKRDSFKHLAASSSSKDYLHTLVEEEEEEEEEEKKGEESNKLDSPLTLAIPGTVTQDSPESRISSSRPRPAQLQLRPLSLTPENLAATALALPTPNPTPNPRQGLKALSLASGSKAVEATEVSSKRISLGASERSSMNLSDSPISPAGEGCTKRRSSISYKRSSRPSTAGADAGLPTPEMTPTSFDHRSNHLQRISSSSGSSDEEFFPGHPAKTRPLKTSEQHFLFKSHNALLARIQDLERALSMRRMSLGGYSTGGSSRPASSASNPTSMIDYEDGEPGNEMLKLVADLKAERDELKQDIDGWRVRVADLEKQLGAVVIRVENERRDAWVARSMAGLLEAEKKALEKRLQQCDETIQALEEQRALLAKENRDMKQQLDLLGVELQHAKQELSEAKESDHPLPDPLATPVLDVFAPCHRTQPYIEKTSLGFGSSDSQSSTTDVEDAIDDCKPSPFLPLVAVSEHDESDFSEEENGLDGYEDENESDTAFQTSSSFDSSDGSPRSLAHLLINEPPTSGILDPTPRTSASPSPSPPPTPQPMHVSRPSGLLSMSWTFPVGMRPVVENLRADGEVDRFFDCLQDENIEEHDSPLDFSIEKSKGVFASGFNYSSEISSPFFLPFGNDTEEVPNTLNAISEDEDAEKLADNPGMLGEFGGIQITCTPPQDDNDHPLNVASSPKKSSPINVLQIDCSEGETSSEHSPAGDNPDSRFTCQVTSKFAIPMSASSSGNSSKLPSSIPRPASVKPPLSDRVSPIRVDAQVSTCLASGGVSTKPSMKRGAIMPSLIPQPLSTSVPLFSSQRRKSTGGQVDLSNNKHGSTSPTQIPMLLNRIMNIPSPRSSELDITSPASTVSSQVTYVSGFPTDTTKGHFGSQSNSVTPEISSSTTSITSTHISSRLSIQTLTNFIPFSWTSRNGVPDTLNSSQTDHACHVVPLKKSRFVSKEIQLEKLRIRLERECTTQVKTPFYVGCKNCEGRNVGL